MFDCAGGERTTASGRRKKMTPKGMRETEKKAMLTCCGGPSTKRGFFLLREASGDNVMKLFR